MIVPQSFRYVETGSTGSSDSFLPARTSASQQQSSVILLEAPLTPVEIAPGVVASPAELLALLNQILTTTIEEAEGAYRGVYEHHAPLMRFLHGLKLPTPTSILDPHPARSRA